jgi:hypothetical protein
VRPAKELVLSGLEAGLTIGFIFVVLASAQLFTENTLEPIVPVLVRAGEPRPDPGGSGGRRPDRDGDLGTALFLPFACEFLMMSRCFDIEQFAGSG